MGCPACGSKKDVSRKPSTPKAIVTPATTVAPIVRNNESNNPRASFPKRFKYAPK